MSTNHEKAVEGARAMSLNKCILRMHQAIKQAASTPDRDEPEQMIETRIYVGLNNADTKTQIHDTEKYINLLKNVCKNYHVAFSVDIEDGGYFHDDGEYTEETSLILLLINVDRNVVREIAQDLCTFFHQESVLVTEDHIEAYFVKSAVN